MNIFRTGIITALLLIFIPFVSAGEGAGPPHKMMEQAFFKCKASRNLEGGNYGKGPFKSFGPERSACSSNEWVRITREEFKALAEKWYGMDWSREISFWSRD